MLSLCQFFPLLMDCILCTGKVNPTIYGFCLFVFVTALFVCRLLKFESISEPDHLHDPDIFEMRYSFFYTNRPWTNERFTDFVWFQKYSPDSCERCFSLYVLTDIDTYRGLVSICFKRRIASVIQCNSIKD